ncbi:MAG: prolipoprotein diacylglyceryl transferase, partial [Deltaproteobacteria bacterium]|nr:prolipoprotein diacylglyceryl transferase [Deltaproteobacteria bacterium]
QLYELILEGPILLALLWWSRDKVRPGGLAALFLISYGSFRFLVEFVREPDAHLGFILAGLTTGQLLCLGQVAAGVVLWRYLAGRKR